MKKLAACATLALATCALAPAFAQTHVGVSIGIQQPGVYGRIDIGNFPQPRVYYPEPIVIRQSPIVMQQQPIYLYVPPGHQKNWAKHCARYNACGQRVYFVREDWVRERYDEQRRNEGHGDRGDRGDRGENDRGHGNGRDKHGKGRD
jgi:hypothetical protein